MTVSIRPCFTDISSNSSGRPADFLGMQCLSVNQPFYLAFLSAFCYDTTHAVISPDACFDPRWQDHGLADYLTIYSTRGGVTLSAANSNATRAGRLFDPDLRWPHSPQFNNHGGPANPRANGTHNFVLPIKRGVSLILRPNGQPTSVDRPMHQIFQHPTSVYNVYFDLEAPPPPSPAPPPPPDYPPPSPPPFPPIAPPHPPPPPPSPPGVPRWHPRACRPRPRRRARHQPRLHRASADSRPAAAQPAAAQPAAARPPPFACAVDFISARSLAAGSTWQTAPSRSLPSLKATAT